MWADAVPAPKPSWPTKRRRAFMLTSLSAKSQTSGLCPGDWQSQALLKQMLNPLWLLLCSRENILLLPPGVTHLLKSICPAAWSSVNALACTGYWLTSTTIPLQVVYKFSSVPIFSASRVDGQNAAHLGSGLSWPPAVCRCSSCINQPSPTDHS